MISKDSYCKLEFQSQKALTDPQTVYFGNRKINLTSFRDSAFNERIYSLISLLGKSDETTKLTTTVENKSTLTINGTKPIIVNSAEASNLEEFELEQFDWHRVHMYQSAEKYHKIFTFKGDHIEGKVGIGLDIKDDTKYAVELITGNINISGQPKEVDDIATEFLASLKRNGYEILDNQK